MIRSFVLCLAAATCFAAPTLASENVVQAASARIHLGGPTTYQSSLPSRHDRFNGGLIYGGENTMTADIEFLSPAGNLVESFPVVMRFRSIGLTAIAGFLGGSYIDLYHVHGRPVRDLLGTYYGLKGGVALFLQGHAGAMTNGAALMTNFSGGVGIGLDLSVPIVTLYRDGNYDWDTRIEIRAD